jgi:hypothetical protein
VELILRISDTHFVGKVWTTDLLLLAVTSGSRVPFDVDSASAMTGFVSANRAHDGQTNRYSSVLLDLIVAKPDTDSIQW